MRLIGQYVADRRATRRSTRSRSTRKDAGFSGSALFAYKLNWQTVFYLGYGDDRAFADVTDQLEPSGRQAFAKVSYAWQR